MATAAWTRTEPRDIRPFFAITQAENALDGCEIKLWPEEAPTDQTSFQLEDDKLGTIQPVLLIKIPPVEEWLPKDEQPSDYELVAIASNSFLKKSEVVLQVPLDEELPEHIEIDHDLVEKLGSGRGLSLTLAICLRHDRDAAPGKPLTVGQWLAEKTFSFSPVAVTSLFELKTRSDDDWLKMHLPAKTFYYVEYIGGIATPEATNVATVYIHEEAQKRLAVATLGRAMQPFITVEIIAQVLEASRHEWDSLEEPPAGTPLVTVLKQLAGSGIKNLADVRTLIAQGRLRPLLQSKTAAVASLA